MNQLRDNSPRKSEPSLRLPSICALGGAPFCTAVKALNSDQAVRGANSSCFGSSHASITFGSREAGRNFA
jgi:hypothetical protein